MKNWISKHWYLSASVCGLALSVVAIALVVLGAVR